MKIAVIEDKPDEANRLIEILSENFNFFEKGGDSIDRYSSGEAFISLFQRGKYDTAFFDIFMNGISGIDAAREIRRIDSDIKIIFCTASNSFASESYSLGASYYLLKPYDRTDVREMLNKIELYDYELSRFIGLPDGRKLILRDIIYTEYFNHIIYIYLKNGRDIKIRMSQTDFIGLLSEYKYLYSCSKGIIINFYEVKTFEDNTVLMKDGIQLPVSRRKSKETSNAFADFQFEILRRRTVF